MFVDDNIVRVADVDAVRLYGSNDMTIIAIERNEKDTITIKFDDLGKARAFLARLWEEGFKSLV